MKQWLTSGLLRKILTALLIVSLIPLLILAGVTVQSYQDTRAEIVDQSRQDLDQKSFEGLTGRTLSLAQTIALFLTERESDLNLLATLPRTSSAFANFAQAKQGRIWTITEDGKEVVFTMPLYREVVYINNEGQELLKVINHCDPYPFSCSVVISDDLVNVSEPANTLFKNETYFSETMALGRGEIYVGRPVGFYQQPENAYAGAQNRGGQRYRGVLRFALPVFEGESKVGVIVAALEMLHLLELTGHVAPSNPELQAEIDPREADFVYLVDPEGWAISHPRHFNIVGVDEKGELAPPISEANRDDPENLYRPGNLVLMNFIDPSFPALVEKNQNGEAREGGVVSARPWGGRERVLSYATIPYHTGRYNNKAGFGLVVMSTDGERFHLEAELLGKRIENRVNELIVQMEWLAGGTFLLGLILAFLLAHNVAWPILRLTTASREIESENWAAARLDELATIKRRDEIAQLSRVFASMAQEIRARVEQLRQKVQQLQIVIDRAEQEREVKKIVESDAFSDIAQKAAQMRARRRAKEQDS
jgi:HAMP domain-containing protein